MYGRPGDNPINDIITHGLSNFGEPIDGLIRQIGEHPYKGVVRKDLDQLLTEHFCNLPNADLEKLKTGLEGLLKTLNDF